MLHDVFEAFFKLGIPVIVISTFAMLRLYGSGELAMDDNQKAVEKKLKNIREGERRDKGRFGNLLETQWFRFGGGFYGAAAVWTFIVVEVQDILRFVQNFTGFDELFEAGLGALIGGFIANQVTNFVTAITWFLFWADGSAIGIWFAVAYGSFVAAGWLSRMLAQRFAR